MRLDGRIALVTGGSRGIGKAIGRQLADSGARVVIVGRDRCALDSAVQEVRTAGGECTSIAGDVTDPADIERIVADVVSQHRTIDVLVNNAATADSAPFLELTHAQWDRIVHANLTGPFMMAQAVARHMVRNGRGVIVNISSISAHGADSMPNYSAAKAGLHSLTRDISTELAAAGVRCVTVTPGWVETTLVADSMSPELLKVLREDFRRVPLKRLLKVDEIAGVVAFLVSDAAAGVTGCEVVVDGGTLGSLYVNTSIR